MRQINVGGIKGMSAVVTTLLASMLISVDVNAGVFARIWQNVCASVVTEDWYPYAEEQVFDLLTWYDNNTDPQILKELVYRYRNGLMTSEETIAFLNFFDGKGVIK